MSAQNPRFNQITFKRITEKYDCILGNKFTSGTSLGEGVLQNSENKIQGTTAVSQKEPISGNQKTEEKAAEPAKVVKLVNSFPG